MIWGQALKNWGQLAAFGGKAAGGIAKGVATGRYGAHAAGAMYGGIAGGAYGAVDRDTSVIGGALGGAMLGGLGGAGVRYGGAAMRAGSFRGGVAAAGRRMMGDIGRVGGSRVRSNSAFTGTMNRIRQFGSGQGAAAAARQTAASAPAGATMGSNQGWSLRGAFGRARSKLAKRPRNRYASGYGAVDDFGAAGVMTRPSKYQQGYGSISADEMGGVGADLSQRAAIRKRMRGQRPTAR